MILIDKEKFIEEVRKRKYSAASIKLIEEQPEVKAVPIEWIEMYYKYRLMPKPVEWFEAIEIMLTDWEKENERTNSNI